MTAGIIIPALDAGNTLDSLLDTVLSHVAARLVLVVDDGSSDSTPDIARKRGAAVAVHRENRGKGAALRTGFSWAIQQNLDAVITLDSDGQHDPACIPRFVETAESTGADLVLGTRRFFSGGMPADRMLSNQLSSLLVSLFAGRKICDSQCGYRLIRSGVLKTLRLDCSRFEMESELLIRAARLGFRFAVCEVPVIYNGSASHMNRWRDTGRFLNMLWRLGLRD